MQVSNSDGDPGDFIKEYSPSWVDYLTRWIDQLPGSNSIYYLGLGLIILLAQVLVLNLDGILNTNLDSAHIFMAAAIPYMLVLINYFNLVARRNLRKLQPSLRLDSERTRLLEKNLATLPALWSVAAGFMGLSCVFLLESTSGAPYILESLENYSLSGNIFRITYLVLWWVFGTLIYHTIHQLRVVGRIYGQLTKINLYQPKNLYTFSVQIALTAFGTFLLPVGFLLANPWASWNEPVVFGTVLAVQLLALGTFVWPHYGIHRLLVAEKENLLENANKRLEVIIEEMHKAVDESNLKGMGDVSTTISSLNAEIETLEKIPTWPWHPETLRFLITALALPLGIWLIQLLLSRLLGS
jgi:hypothetical protein